MAHVTDGKGTKLVINDEPAGEGPAIPDFLNRLKKPADSPGEHNPGSAPAVPDHDAHLEDRMIDEGCPNHKD